MEAFQAKTPAEMNALRQSSGDFPKLDRMVCSWLTRGEALQGQFGPRIQSYIEIAITNYQVLRGRPILNMIVREFGHLDGAGSVISAVELFPIPGPEGDFASLVTCSHPVTFDWQTIRCYALDMALRKIEEGEVIFKCK